MTQAPHRGFWEDPEKVALLKKYWAQKDLSAAEIAKLIGAPSRNSVIAKANRLKLESRADKVPHNFQKSKKGLHVDIIAMEPIIESKGISFRDVEANQCRWLFNDPKKDMTCCGNRTVPHKPYCGLHFCMSIQQGQNGEYKFRTSPGPQYVIDEYIGKDV